MEVLDPVIDSGRISMKLRFVNDRGTVWKIIPVMPSSVYFKFWERSNDAWREVDQSRWVVFTSYLPGTTESDLWTIPIQAELIKFHSERLGGTPPKGCYVQVTLTEWVRYKDGERRMTIESEKVPVKFVAPSAR